MLGEDRRREGLAEVIAAVTSQAKATTSSTRFRRLLSTTSATLRRSSLPADGSYGAQWVTKQKVKRASYRVGTIARFDMRVRAMSMQVSQPRLSSCRAKCCNLPGVG
ncbi:hypothetical protein RI054_18g82230 [Pseudoscourfieldia marina]